MDIEGVQPAALDQPRVNIHLRREIKGQPLSTKKSGEDTINVQAFLDTGASGIMLSKTTSDALGVKRLSAAGTDVVFHDVGVAGGDTFNVGEPLYVFVAPTRPSGPPDTADEYPIRVGPVRAQIGPLSAGLMEMLTGGMDVVGMPAIRGHVMVMDPRPVDTFGDTMRCGLFEVPARGARNNIPATDRHVRVSYGSFERFTHTTPANAPMPTLAENPFIGPDPTGRGANVPPIAITYGGKSIDVSMLLDTGAAASMLSEKQAATLGVRYVPGTKGTESPKLAGIADSDQFTFTVGGVGGTSKVAGFFLDALRVPTRENDPLVYLKAPVLVTDITVEDPSTRQHVTLDGVFGMNYLVASAFVSEAGIAGLPDIGKMTQGPYEWVVFDAPAGELAVKLKPEFLKPKAGASKIEIKRTSRSPKRN